MADYLTLESYLQRARITTHDSNDDASIETYITMASRQVDNDTGREENAFASGASALRYFAGSGTAEQWIDPCTTITVLATSDDDGATWDSWAVTDYWKSSGAQFDTVPYQLLVANPNGDYSIFPRGVRSVRVTATWGWATTVPEPIQQAVFRLARAAWLLRESGGAEDRAMATSAGVWLPSGAIPKDYYSLIAPYRRLV